MQRLLDTLQGLQACSDCVQPSWSGMGHIQCQHIAHSSLPSPGVAQAPAWPRRRQTSCCWTTALAALWRLSSGAAMCMLASPSFCSSRQAPCSQGAQHAAGLLLADCCILYAACCHLGPTPDDSIVDASAQSGMDLEAAHRMWYCSMQPAGICCRCAGHCHLPCLLRPMCWTMRQAHQRAVRSLCA